MQKSVIHLFIAALVVAAVRAQENTNGQTLHQGDIMLTDEQQATLEAVSNPNDPFSPQQAVVRNERSLWPNARVPYIIDSSLGEAMQYWLNHCSAVVSSIALATYYIKDA